MLTLRRKRSFSQASGASADRCGHVGSGKCSATVSAGAHQVAISTLTRGFRTATRGNRSRARHSLPAHTSSTGRAETRTVTAA